MANNSVVQTIKNAEIDARSLSQFIYSPADVMIERRLAPHIHSLQYYLDFLERIPSIVQSAIDATVVEGAVVTADTVAVDGSTTQRVINRGLESVAGLATIQNPKDGLRVYVKHFYRDSEGGGGFFEYRNNLNSFDGGVVIDPLALSSFDGTINTIDDYLLEQAGSTGTSGWVREDTAFVRPEMFGAKAGIDIDMSSCFNAMYKSSEEKGFQCGSVKKKTYRIYKEVDVQGADATAGFTEFYLRDDVARLRIRAKTRARFFSIETKSGYTGNAVYLNGTDGWGTEYQQNMFDDLHIKCPSVTGTAIYLDCTEPNSRIAYAHSTNVRIEGFENGLFLHAAAKSGFSFINANSFTNYMGGAQCKNFIKMIADKAAGGSNDVDSNKLVSFDFQNKNGDNALYMQGCQLNQLLGHTYFDLTAENSVVMTDDSVNNYIQGAWLQPFESISPTNTVINMNNSTTYKSYQKTRALFTTEFVERERFLLTPNESQPLANEGSYYKTANTSSTTYTRFRNVLNGKHLSILVDDNNTLFKNNEYLSMIGKGEYFKAVKGVIYNFNIINGVAVMQETAVSTLNASETISTGTQVFGVSNNVAIGRNAKWARVLCEDGVVRMVPVWDIPK